MDKSDLRRLRAISKRWLHERQRLLKKNEIERDKAGHSNTPDGTGDEGWNALFERDGQASGLLWCAADLNKLLDSLGHKMSRKRARNSK